MNREHRFFFFGVVPVLVLAGAQFCFPAIYSGMVVDSANGGRGIPGVLVAAGYGLNRTLSDSTGRFTLDVGESAVRRIPVPGTAPVFSITWNMRQRFLDLTAAPEITAVAVYRPDGSRVWNVTCAAPGTNRILTTPPMVPGVYIMTFLLRNNCRVTWRSVQGFGGRSCRFASPAQGSLHRTAAALSGQGVNIIFRHDRYFPLDRQVATPATDLVIPLQPDPTAAFFNETTVHTFSFTLTGEDSLSMERNALAEEFISAALTIDGSAFGKVGLRYKGSDYYSMPRCFDKEGNRGQYDDCRNVSLKVKFDKHDDDARLFGMKRLNLHSMSYDDSKIREMLAYGFFRETGLYTCRTVFVKVLVNGVSRGIFAGVEEVDGRFTKSRWHETGDGNLYKEVWPIYGSKSRYRKALKTNDNPEDSADVSRMVDFYHAIETSTPENFTATISPFMDLDYWLRFIVVDRAIHNGDGVMTWYVDGSWLSNHNYYFYEDEAAGGKFWLIPWDMNATFTKTDPIFDDHDMPEWFETPDSCEPVEIWNGSLAVPPNCDRLTNLTAATCWNRFVSLGEQFLDDIFTPARMNERIDAWAKVIEPEMKNDPYVEPDTWSGSVEWLRNIMTSLHNGFNDHLHPRGTTEDTTGYTTPFPEDSGFTPALLNNFEFGAEAAIDSWVHAYVSENSSVELFLDTAGPIGGGSDLRCNYILRPADPSREYSEWLMIMIGFKTDSDCSGLTGLRVNLRSDKNRQVNIGLLSDVYARNDIPDGEWYGWVVAAGPKARPFTLDIRDIDYPEWATHSRPELFDSVLAKLAGIWISPNPVYGGDGELLTVPDSGFLKIDNILFTGVSE